MVVLVEAIHASSSVLATTVGEDPHVIKSASAQRRGLDVERQFTVAQMARAYEQIYLDVLQ